MLTSTEAKEILAPDVVSKVQQALGMWEQMRASAITPSTLPMGKSASLSLGADRCFAAASPAKRAASATPTAVPLPRSGSGSPQLSPKPMSPGVC